MLKTVEGIYRNGRVELAESVDESANGTRVLVTFLPEAPSDQRVDLRTRGIDEDDAVRLRAQLASFAEDWNDPEMAVYDDYDAAQSQR